MADKDCGADENQAYANGYEAGYKAGYEKGCADGLAEQRQVKEREIERKLREVADGTLTIKEIAAVVGLSYSAAHIRIRKYELKVRRVKYRKWDRYFLALEQRRAGKTLREVGVSLGVGVERARQMIIHAERRELRMATGEDMV